MEHKLDCCVVRDLLPAYLEGLTEEETTRQVEAHLEECPECRRRREAMQASLPVVRAPKRALAFLKKVKRTRLIAAVLSAVVALLLIFLVYDSEYHWRGDLPSLTQGLQDYLGWTCLLYTSDPGGVPMAFQNRLYELRKKAGLSQEGLADLLGVTRQAVQKWEAGSSRPDMDNLAALARYFNVTLDYLVTGREPEPYAQEVPTTIITVSYTHLDVYKRQPSACPS